MEKDKGSYRSHNALGLLYDRIINRYKKNLDDIELERYSYSLSISNNGFEVFIEFACIFYDMFYNNVQIFLKKYKIKSEFELFTSILINFNKDHTTHNIYEIQNFIQIEIEDFISICNNEYNTYIYYFYSAISVLSDNNDWEFVVKNKLSMEIIKSIIKQADDDYEILDKEIYSKYNDLIKAGFSNKNNKTLFENIKSAILSAIIFVSHSNLISSVKLLNEDIFKNSVKYMFENKYISCEIYEKYKRLDKTSIDDNLKYNFLNKIYPSKTNNENGAIIKELNNEKIYEYENLYSFPWVVDTETLLKLDFFSQ